MQISACEYLTDNTSINKKYIKIFCDSQACLKALNAKEITSNLVYDTITSLETLTKTVKRCTLVWIKAHVGYEGNEMADLCARQATIMPENTTTPVPKNTIKKLLNEAAYQQWQKNWNTEKTCRQTKQFFDLIDSNKSKKILKLGRMRLSVLISLITGHNNLAYHSYVQDNTIDPTCRLCEEAPEAFFHFVNDCPRLRQLRQEIFRNEPIEGTHSWAIGRILELSQVPAIDALLTWE